MVYLGPIDLRPDPGLSNHRPGWLADDHDWRNQLDAMTREDTAWAERHWELAGGTPPQVDTSWLTMEYVDRPHWAWPIVLVFWVLIVGVPIALTIDYLIER